MTIPENTGREQDGRFRRGQSGNPNGKPRGRRHKTTLAVEELLDGEGEALTRKAIELAKAGDLTALRLCLERIAPVRKDRPVMFALPKLETPSDAVRTSAALVEAVANGELTPGEAGDLSRLIEAFTRAVEAHEFEDRISRLEQRINQ